MAELTKEAIYGLVKRKYSQAKAAILQGGVKLSDSQKKIWREAEIYWDVQREQEKERGPLSNADRQAAFVAKRSELGEIPAPANPARREECRLDLLKFGLTYALGKGLGFLLKHEPSELMLDYVRAVQAAHLNGEMVHPRFPRGKGKTSWLKIGCIWAASYGHSRFMVLGAANQDNANSILDDIWEFLEECEPYGEDFPEIAIPVRALEGRMQRCNVQMVGGKRTKIKKSKDRIIFPTVEGSDASGVVLISRGRDSGVRGIVRGSQRPDFLGIDDPQTRKSAKSTSETSNILSWIQGDIFGLVGHDKMPGAVLTTTPICAGDVSEQCADRDLHPEWTTISIPLVIQWPERMDLWNTYLDRCRRDKLSNQPTFPSATKFYRANRADMDRGAIVLDPQDGAEHELSALQHAFNLLFRVGQESFDAEYQLKPKRPDSAYALTPKEVSGNISLTDRLVMPNDFHAAVAFIDCMSRDALRWVIMAVSSQRRACVVAYGRYPESGMLFPPNSPVPVQNKTLGARLMELVDSLAVLPLPGNGTISHVSAIGIDRGWKPRIVEWVCTRSKHTGILYPSLGYAWSKYAPERQNGKRKDNVLGIGDHCFLAKGKGFRYIGHHADYWREYAQRSFLVPALTAGSTAIYGSDPLAHYDFACEICAEQLVDKGVGENQTEFWRWAKKPGAQNHGLDEVTGALALASYLRLYDTGQLLAGTSKKKPKRRSRVRLVRR